MKDVCQSLQMRTSGAQKREVNVSIAAFAKKEKRLSISLKKIFYILCFLALNNKNYLQKILKSPYLVLLKKMMNISIYYTIILEI